MIKVNVGLSRKLSQDYNSHGFSLNLEGEVTAPVSDPEGVVEQVRELYDLAEEALAQQIERHQSDSAIASRDHDTGRPSPPRNGNGHSNGNGQRGDQAATNKQVQYLLSLGRQRRLSTVQLEAKVAEIVGRSVGLYDLTKREAGDVIDALTADEPANGRR